MAKNLKNVLSENKNLSEEMKQHITDAWEEKLEEARLELRQEYARKYQHDKAALAESMDKFLTDRLTVELEEFAQDKQKLAQERVLARQAVKEHAKMLDQFIMEQLSTEIQELREDRRKLNENFTKLENFTLQQLSEEIAEFREDKRKLVEQKVRMVNEGRKQLQQTKQKFIERAAIVVESKIEKTLRSEISQFKEDIRAARENEFGRRIFESFASEFLTSYLNEGSELSKLQQQIREKQTEVNALKESLSSKDEKAALLESKLKSAQDRMDRSRVLGKLLRPLSNEKRTVMKDLLESVQTSDLERTFDKYLPAVLNETVSRKHSSHPAKGDKALMESKVEMTGNRAKQALQESVETDKELAQLKLLAGLN